MEWISEPFGQLLHTRTSRFFQLRSLGRSFILDLVEKLYTFSFSFTVDETEPLLTQ